ncbi:hypothetical protein N7492_000400 [Penicillium capsulatum]|uniref:Putative zinc-finger domain-containing protein n=1 Tax=Penicillium capsulatum TaxID=69766 RepID=A0A9W9LZD2_9EURO|nr:hypothetical protein N7492_000400 [Penicillium capsulatum]KAJ6130538.1 hypothetical protein N7512_003318 [Penicillium capsulatum]
MSNQPPPSFGDHPNYAQQWPPLYPPMVPPGLFPNPELPPAGQPPSTNPELQLPFSMEGFNMNSQFPGSGGQGTPAMFFPPIPFMPPMTQFPPSPYPPLPVHSGFSYPPVPPPGSSKPPQGPPPGNEAPVAQHQARERTIPLSDPYREEGEVSEPESAPYSPPANNDQGMDQQTRHPGLENNAAMSSPSSSRSSSPYNPPLSVSADPNVVDRAIEMQKHDVMTPKASEDSQSPRSAIQLRVQAQGALLSLAPHNIRYDELVAEGIKPAILKQLYAEVGLKVPSQPEKPAESSVSSAKSPGVPAIERSVTCQRPTIQPQPVSQMKKKPSQDLTMPVSQLPAQMNPEKPLERKEVIARMLAAKAAKASVVSISKAGSKKDQAPAIESPAATPPDQSQGKENSAPIREKNKASTELARQRIEQLKQQALLKSQQKTQEPSQPAPVYSSGEISSGPSTPSVQHPLPVRPPLPQSSSLNAIPGLSVPGRQQDSGLISPQVIAPGITIDSAPVVRASQRKRPLAADFDEPPMLAKRASSHPAPRAGSSEKLIIDISDDESLYGDDGETTDMDPGQEQDTESNCAIDNTQAPPQTSLSTTRTSTSTPQGLARPSDHEDIRKRDLAIQAMHRRIAELEERRKVKRTRSRAGSPRFAHSSSAASSAVQLSPVDPDAAQETSSGPASGLKVAANSGTSMSSFSDRMNLIDSLSDSSVKILASVGTAQLDSLRSKIIHMKEIESGLPGLEVETSSSESALDACKQEADKMLSEVAPGKESRLELIEGLKNLSYEMNGLTLEHLEDLRRQAEIRQLHLSKVECDNTTSPIMEDSTMPDACLSTAQAVADKLAVPDSEAESPEDIHSGSEGSHGAVEPLTASGSDSGSSMDESIKSSSGESSNVEHSPTSGVTTALHGPSLADVTGPVGGNVPVMDESFDGTRTRPSSLDEFEPRIPESSTPNGTFEEPSQALADSASPHAQSITAGDLEHPLPERPQAPVTENINPMDLYSSQTQNHEQVHREPSIESDAYEPPEPGASTNSLDLAYSPHFSPAPLDPVGDAVASVPSLDASRPDEPLMHKNQASVPEVPRNTQVEVLGDQAPATHLEPSFTSYVSPLRHFKAYRYHPNFAEDTPGGYRSLTYSHNIDSMKHLCPFELAGGVCNDRSCGFQHFRDINLSDDKILIQMGAVREGQTDDEKETYLAGLKEIINEMRRGKVKDFSTVANEIAAYRRRFLQDPSRVLAL